MRQPRGDRLGEHTPRASLPIDHALVQPAEADVRNALP